MIDIVVAAWVLVTRPAWLGSWSAARRRGVGSGLHNGRALIDEVDVDGRAKKAVPRQKISSNADADPRTTSPCGGSSL